MAENVTTRDGRDFVGYWDGQQHLIFWDTHQQEWSGIANIEYKEPEYWRELNDMELKRKSKWEKFIDKWS
jgi:hypothetical protein